MHKAFTLIKLMVVCAIITLLYAITVGAGGDCSNADGARVGSISKFSHKGIFVKSWEGEMVLGGLRQQATDKGSTMVANVWDFTVIDPAVVKKIQALQDSGHRAKLTYRQTVLYNPFRRNTAYIVSDAADLDAPPVLEK